MASCIACHGADAKGVQGLGKSLHPSDSEFVSQNSDEELVEFIKVGRQPGEPGNTTGVAMPPKGGNPAISDEDLYDIVAWMRTLD
jgi:disulfide bond formation protein DsbB